MTERHVKRFVLGKLLPVRGSDNRWESRYGWHWVVEGYVEVDMYSGWEAREWLHGKSYDRKRPSFPVEI